MAKARAAACSTTGQADKSCNTTRGNEANEGAAASDLGGCRIDSTRENDDANNSGGIQTQAGTSVSSNGRELAATKQHGRSYSDEARRRQHEQQHLQHARDGEADARANGVTGACVDRVGETLVEALFHRRNADGWRKIRLQPSMSAEHTPRQRQQQQQQPEQQQQLLDQARLLMENGSHQLDLQHKQRQQQQLLDQARLPMEKGSHQLDLQHQQRQQQQQLQASQQLHTPTTCSKPPSPPMLDERGVDAREAGEDGNLHNDDVDSQAANDNSAGVAAAIPTGPSSQGSSGSELPGGHLNDSIEVESTSQSSTKPAWNMIEVGLLFTDRHTSVFEETCSRGVISSGSTGGKQHDANDCIEQFSEQNPAVQGPVGGQSARRRIRGKQPAADSEELPAMRGDGEASRDSCIIDVCVGEAGECKRRRLHGTASNKRLSAESDTPSSKKPRRPG